MSILLDHTIVPSHDPVGAARRLAELLDVPWEVEKGGFTPVYVSDSLTLDFGKWEHFEGHHYCFKVSDAEFDAILGRIQAAHIDYRGTPWGEPDMRVNTGWGGKVVYWDDPEGHIWEMLTVSYARAEVALPSKSGP